MADRPDPLALWATDLAALGERTQDRFPSIDETRRRLVLASANQPHNREPDKERTMSFVRRKPALAAVIALALLAILTPVAYAVVTRVLIQVDTDQPPEQIERDVTHQLEQAGVKNPVVNAQKDGDSTQISIETDDQRLANGNLDVQVKGTAGADCKTRQRQLALRGQCDLTAAQQQQLIDVAKSQDMTDLLSSSSSDESDADLAADIEDVLADHGFTDARVTVNGDSIQADILSPPQAPPAN